MPSFLRSLMDAPMDSFLEELYAEESRHAPRAARPAPPQPKTSTQTQEVPLMKRDGEVKRGKRKSA